VFSWQDRCCTLSHCNTLYHTIPPHTYRCLVFWRVAPLVTAMHCNRLQHRIPINALCFGELDVAPLATATHCSTLQHTATHCNTLQRRIPIKALCFGELDVTVGEEGVQVWRECNERVQEAILFRVVHHLRCSVLWCVAVCCGDQKRDRVRQNARRL